MNKFKQLPGWSRLASALVVVLAVASLSLAGCSSSHSAAACTRSSSGLTVAKNASGTTLPPSHDNDAGDGRIPDTTPDADIDASQRHQLCPRTK